MSANPISATAGIVDWECADAETQYLTHGIHRYSGKFIPQVAKSAIELLTEEGDLVLDLYSGSGTTLLEAAINKRRSIGVDLNPLAVLIAKVKTTPIGKKCLVEWAKDFIETILSYSDGDSQQVLLFNAREPGSSRIIIDEIKTDKRLHDEWYTKWFQQNALRELIWIDLNIEGIRDERIRCLAIVTLSDILRKCSNAHSSYPNVMFDKNKKQTRTVIPQYVKRLREIVDAVSNLDSHIDPRFLPEIIEANNTRLPLESESIDAIITHPPYIGSVPYAEYGLLSITWLNRNPKELDAILTGGKRQQKSVVERFYRDYAKMFNEAHRVLRGKKYMFLVVGSPTVRGERIDLTAASIQHAEQANFSLTAKIRRKGVNRRANLMGDESILFFQKK